MKKITMLISAGVFILTLAGCGSEEQGSESEDGTSTEGQTETGAFA